MELDTTCACACAAIGRRGVIGGRFTSEPTLPREGLRVPAETSRDRSVVSGTSPVSITCSLSDDRGVPPGPWMEAAASEVEVMQTGVWEPSVCWRGVLADPDTDRESWIRSSSKGLKAATVSAK